jgi:hypothetical protein
MSLTSLYRASVAALVFLPSLPSARAQLRQLDNYAQVTQYGNDDDSTDAVAFGFSANLFGTTYSDLFINNNGNVTFAFPSGLGNPSSINGGLAQQGGPVLAPFFTDIDTTYAGSLSYGTGTIGAFNAFVTNWTDVAAFGSGLQPTTLNTFQLFMVDRSDTGLGNFDFEFNYTKIRWDEGANSTGVTALVGFSDAASTNFLLPGSGMSGAFFDNGPADRALIHNSLGVPFDGATMDGRYAFNVRGGLVSFAGPGFPPDDGGPTQTAVPEPATYGLLGCAALAALALRRRSKRG